MLAPADYAELDLATRPSPPRVDAIVHAAIWNDFRRACCRDRRARLGRLRRRDAQRRRRRQRGRRPVVLVSTDWVFDGTQGPARRGRAAEPGQRLRLPEGRVRAGRRSSARRGIVARIAGVQGVHRAEPHAPRAQDAGFGYFVARARRRAARRASVHGVGRARHQRARHADARHRRGRADLAGARARGHRHAALRAAASTSTGSASRAAPSPRSGSTRTLLHVGAAAGACRASRVPYDTRLDATATAPRWLDARARRDVRHSCWRARMGFDVITMGRIGVDLYPQQIGVSLREVDVVRQVPRRLLDQRRGRGRALRPRAWPRSRARATTRSASYLHDALQGFGVDDRWVTPVDGLPTPRRLLRDLPARRLPAVLLPRARRRPTWRSTRDELDLEAIRAAKIFWATVTGLSQEPSRSATLAALEASAGHHRARPRLAADVLGLARGGAQAGRARRCATPTSRSATRTSGRPRRRGATARRGSGRLRRQARAARASSRSAATSPSRSRPRPVEVVNGLGAGDAFGGALCHGLLAELGAGADDALRNAAGAIVAVAARLRRRHAHRRRESRRNAGGDATSSLELTRACASSSSTARTASTPAATR